MAVRTGAGVFDVSHMGEIETRGPQAHRAPPAPALQRRLADPRGRRPVQRALPRGRRRARRPLHLPPGRALLPDGHQRRQPRARPRVVREPTRATSTPTWSTASTTSRCSRSRGRTPASWSAVLPTGSCRSACTSASARSRAPASLVCGTGYTGEDGVELLIAPARRRGASGTRCSGAGAVPVGLGARDTLRLEVCFHLYGNDLSEDRGPIEAGLGWCCKEDTGFIGSEAVAAARAAGPAEKLVPFALTGPGSRARATPWSAAARSPAGRSRRAWTSASAWPTCPPSAPSRVPRSRSTSAARSAAREVKEKPLYRKDAP